MQWYTKLLEDLRKLEYTGIVLTKWNIGKRICEDELKFGKPEYGTKKIENLARDLGTSSDDIYASVRFYKKYLDGVQQLEGKSWRDIWHSVLPEPRPQKTEEERQELREALERLGEYNVIYADPPWRYSDKLIEGYGGAEHHYETMGLEEICSLKVPSSENAALFIWVTSPLLEDVFRVINAWGFVYKSSFVWDKVKHNFGHYNSVRHELLLICTKGQFSPSGKVLRDSVIEEERGEHSEKPEIFYEIIEEMYPDCKYVELFARRKREGWASWGDQI